MEETWCTYLPAIAVQMKADNISPSIADTREAIVILGINGRQAQLGMQFSLQEVCLR